MTEIHKTRELNEEVEVCCAVHYQLHYERAIKMEVLMDTPESSVNPEYSRNEEICHMDPLVFSDNTILTV